jgi:uncharacterized membrane protein
MACKTAITHERLREVLDYDPETGIFTWRVSRGKAKKGSVAGRINQTTGYVEIGLDGALIGAHIFAWLYMTGEWPPNLIDHKNRKRPDNRWENLRPSDYSKNRKNAKLNSNNTSGYPGVTYLKRSGKWRAVLKKWGRTRHLGEFATREEAILRRKQEDAVHFGEFASS